MIDSRNGGQTCLQCRNFFTETKRKDPFFGELTVHSYCKKFERTVHPEEGQDCFGFIKTLFSRSATK